MTDVPDLENLIGELVTLGSLVRGAVLEAKAAARFVADVRPNIDRVMAARGEGTTGLCAHPYDLASSLIATEAGVLVTNSSGDPLAYPLDATTPCGWIGYANDAIRAEMESTVLSALRQLEVEAGIEPEQSAGR